MLIKTKRLKLTNFQMDYVEEFTKALNDQRIFYKITVFRTI